LHVKCKDWEMYEGLTYVCHSFIGHTPRCWLIETDAHPA